jgi:hypothetical protein
MKHWLLILPALWILGACSPSSDGTPKIAEDQRTVLEKAKAVDTLVQQSGEQTKQAIEDASE